MEETMKNLICLFGILLSIAACSRNHKQDFEVLNKNGVSIILNHHDSKNADRLDSGLRLEEELVIDTEKNEYARFGLADVNRFDIDSEGHIFFFQSPSNNSNLAYIFDQNGTFIKSFAPVGQGPGEIQWPTFIPMTAQNRILIADRPSKKLHFFANNGEWEKAINFPFNFFFFY